jgi:micrococcal nuclease
MKRDAKMGNDIRKVLLAVALLAAVFSLILCHKPGEGAEEIKGDSYQVKRVVDGDTFIATDGGADIRVRLIGVDTPETVHPNKPVEYFGKEASEFLKQLLTGKEVRLGYDPANAASKHLDRYGRLLAYAWLLPDSLFVNAEIIRRGYGFAYVKYPFEYMEQFRAHEREARERQRGLWGKE